MIQFLEKLPAHKLLEIAAQARIPQIYQLSRFEIIDEIEEDYWNCLYEAIVEHSRRGFCSALEMTAKYFYSDI